MTQLDNSARLARLDKLARTLDSKFRIPGTKIRFGWDGILSIVPVAGDTVAGAMAAYLIWEAYQGGARKRTLAKMGVNAGLDYLFGSIPVVGTIFDVAYKANLKNLELAKAELGRNAPPRDVTPTV
ncbi:DUF4112 domain-containing protein [Roseobacter sp. HKCCA0434]|uniref:DUF4112 domain-containing protein n=1 Tax=Roseobacter sp. HKCCA0434 TaxID=3079297 RepID=UPI002905844C|nr:DUF4112 domain-containing protein [Roseobacter sp. HKCCA0434]